MKRTVVYSKELKQEGRALPCLTTFEKATQISHHSACVCEWVEKYMNTDFRDYKYTLANRQIYNTEFINEDWLYTHPQTQ